MRCRANVFQMSVAKIKLLYFTVLPRVIYAANIIKTARLLSKSSIFIPIKMFMFRIISLHPVTSLHINLPVGLKYHG